MSHSLAAVSALVMAFLAPFPAFAAGYGLINETVTNTGFSLPNLGGLPCGGAGCGFIAIALEVIARFRPLATVIGGLVIAIFGIRMMIGQEDDIITKARTVMTGIMSGLILIWLVEPFVDAFYGGTGERFQGDVAGTVTIASREVGGIIRWVLTLASVVAVLMIIISALKALFKPMNDESIANLRKTILGIAAGLVLMMFHQFIADNFLGSTLSPLPFLQPVVEIVKAILTLLALAALLALIYAGANMIFSLGKDDAWQKAKSLLARMAVGFLVILLSLVLVDFVIQPAIGYERGNPRSDLAPPAHLQHVMRADVGRAV